MILCLNTAACVFVCVLMYTLGLVHDKASCLPLNHTLSLSCVWFYLPHREMKLESPFENTLDKEEDFCGFIIYLCFHKLFSTQGSPHWHMKAERFALALECRAVHTGTGVQSSSHWHWSAEQFMLAPECVFNHLSESFSGCPLLPRGANFDLPQEALCGLTKEEEEESFSA